MKYFIISDIHGSSYFFEKAYEYYLKYKCEKMLILGDILYHGPRNDLPKGHNVKRLIELLNNNKDNIIAVKGNCDAEVDQMVLEFDILDNFNLFIDGVNYYLTHGHHLEKEKPFKKCTIILYGHTHVYDFKNEEGVIYFNPGSVSIPKINKEHTFAILENNIITLFDVEGNIINKYEVN